MIVQCPIVVALQNMVEHHREESAFENDQAHEIWLAVAVVDDSADHFGKVHPRICMMVWFLSRSQPDIWPNIMHRQIPAMSATKTADVLLLTYPPMGFRLPNKPSALSN